MKTGGSNVDLAETAAEAGPVTVAAGAAITMVKTEGEAGAMWKAAGTAMTVQAIRIQGHSSCCCCKGVCQGR
jgi:hypothetical protein